MARVRSDGPGEADGEPPFLDTRRKWLSAGALVAAIAMTAWWAAMLHRRATSGPGYDPLVESYFSGKAIGVFGTAALIGGVANLFRRRNWTRFFAAYAAVLALNVPSELIRSHDSDADPTGARVRQRATALNQRAASVGREQDRLLAELQRTPPLSPEGLSSEEAIAASENRLAGVLNVLDASDQLASSFAPNGRDADLAGLLHQQRQAQRTLFAASRQMLRHLRVNWGAWQFDTTTGRIQFSSEEVQQGFNELNMIVSSAQEETNRLDDKVRARAPVAL